ncbi:MULTISPECIES: NAD-dependent epimerase/dehydratase family protein [unclassified Schlesneria]|uniref:NAD-dependent epimerase/dehydratase family protein n=1 Tax=Schlesneria TaxID=656899 RepID=UPI002F16AFE6
MQRCLVTGGAGFIGSHLSERLLEKGYEVTILDDLSTGRRENLVSIENHPRLTIRTGSITDSVLLAEVMTNVDVIYHMAAAVGVKLVADDPVRTIQTNIYPTEELLRLAVQRKQRVFIASTSEVYGKNEKERWTEEDNLVFGPTSRPRWAYGCSKAIDEFLALAFHRQFGLPVVIGRFFNVVGPRQVGHYGMVIPRFVDAALQGGPIVVYDDGQQIRCFGHVREIVEAVIGLVETPAAHGSVYNIGSDFPVTIRQLAEEIIQRVNPAIKVEYLPYREAYGDDFEDVRRRVPDVSRLENMLGRKPEMSLGEILDDIIRWKREQLTATTR